MGEAAHGTRQVGYDKVRVSWTVPFLRTLRRHSQAAWCSRPAPKPLVDRHQAQPSRPDPAEEYRWLLPGGRKAARLHNGTLLLGSRESYQKEADFSIGDRRCVAR